MSTSHNALDIYGYKYLAFQTFDGAGKSVLVFLCSEKRDLPSKAEQAL